jgi:hypothetical protein
MYSVKKAFVVAVVVVIPALLVAGRATPKTWHVPGDVGTLKEAVEDSSAYGDTVLVAAATYDTTSGETFPIVMSDGVVLLGEAGAGATVIDAGLTARVFNCIDLDSTTVIEGFTITGGIEIQGGGLYCVNSSLTIRSNLITGNVGDGTTAQGGGIYLNGGAPVIMSNEITGNKARKNMGGGMFCGGGAAAVIEDNNISRNVAKFGGGIFMQYCGPFIRGNTFSGNRSVATGAGVDCSFNSYAVVTHNVIVHNRANSDGAGIACCYGATPTIAYNTIAGNSGTFGGGVRSLGNCSPAIWANIIVDNVDAIHLLEDSDSVYAHANNMYCNPYQSGDHEVVNHTTYDIDITQNYWDLVDSLSIAGLISGPAHFTPYAIAPIDTVPGEPSAVTSLVVMEDDTYTSPLTGPVATGDTLFIEVEGTDWNGEFIEPVLTVLTSTVDPVGIAVALVETGPATGIYRGEAYVDTLSDDLLDRIGVNSGDEIVVRVRIEPSVFYAVTVAIAGVGQGVRETRPDRAGRIDAGNYPDPFCRETRIEFNVPVTDHVTVEIYNVLGELVDTLVDERRPAGSYSITWGAGDQAGDRVATGIYFCRVVCGQSEHVEKMILMRR